MGADPNASPLRHVRDPPGQLPSYEQTVAGAEVLDGHPLVGNHDARMAARDERVFDGDMASNTATEDALSTGQVDLLQQETEAISSQTNHPGDERVVAVCAGRPMRTGAW